MTPSPSITTITKPSITLLASSASKSKGEQREAHLVMPLTTIVELNAINTPLTMTRKICSVIFVALEAR